MNVGDQFIDPYGPKRGRVELEIVRIDEGNVNVVIAVPIKNLPYEQGKAAVVHRFSSKIFGLEPIEWIKQESK